MNKLFYGFLLVVLGFVGVYFYQDTEVQAEINNYRNEYQKLNQELRNRSFGLGSCERRSYGWRCTQADTNNIFIVRM
jgi:hypothetical protein